MATLNLLLLENERSADLQIQKVMGNAGFNVTTTVVHDKKKFIEAISAHHYDAVLIFHPVTKFSAKDALALLNDAHIATAIIIIAEKITQNYLTKLVVEGAHDYILKDSIERLPIAVMNAIEKISLKAEQERFFDELITRKTLMKDAERLAHFGSWREDFITGTTYWSDEKFRILGYEPGEVAPTWENFLNKIHPDDVEFVKNVTEEAKKNRNRQKYTFKIASAKGPVKYIHCEIFITRDATLKVTQLNGFIHDVSEHTEAEIKLVESEEKYRSLFENNPSALFVIEAATGRFMDVNRAAIEQYGFTRKEFLTMNATDLNTDEERGPASGQYNPYLDGIGQKQVWKNRKKDGTVLYVEVSTSEIIFEDKPCKLVLSNDVTDKQEALNQVKESEARLITSQRIAHIGSWEVDLSGNQNNKSPIKWTDETFRIFGFEPNEIDPNKAGSESDLFMSLVHKDDHSKLNAALENAIKNKSEYNVEFRLNRRNDGSQRIITELAEIIFDPETGKQLKITGTVQDITDRRLAAKLLQKSEANLRSIFENTETVYVLLDLNLHIVSYNSPAYKFSVKHLNREIAEDTYAVDYFPKDIQAQVKKSLKDALAGNNLNYEVSFPEPDGSIKWYYAHFHPVWSEEQKMLGVIMSLRDITERKTSEIQEKKITAELIQRNKDLEQFAYIISHNLRAPVANIIGVADALNDVQIEEDERIFFLEGLKTSAKKLDDIITDLNRILQMKHEVNENKEIVHFSQLVKDIKFTIVGLAETDLFQIKYDFTEVDEMLTLKSYIHSIFYNLISNSLKYKQPDLIPVIEIVSRKYDNKIELTFIDNGLGIDLKKNGEQLFGLYKRFHQKAAEGKGMGLFMVKTQVETLGGKITVESAVGEGTTFKIEFEIPVSLN